MVLLPYQHHVARRAGEGLSKAVLMLVEGDEGGGSPKDEEWHRGIDHEG